MTPSPRTKELIDPGRAGNATWKDDFSGRPQEPGMEGGNLDRWEGRKEKTTQSASRNVMVLKPSFRVFLQTPSPVCDRLPQSAQPQHRCPLTPGRVTFFHGVFHYLEETKTSKYWANLTWVVVSNICYFHPYLGKWSNLTNIFEMGWNHQPVTFH